MLVFKIATEGSVADKYHGCGHAIAAVANGRVVDFVYVGDVLPDYDDEDPGALENAVQDDRLGPTIDRLKPQGEIFAGMCSCYEFVVL